MAGSGDADPATDPAEPRGAEPAASGPAPGEAEASEPGPGEEGATTPAPARRRAARTAAAKKPAAKRPAARTPAAGKPAPKRTAAPRKRAGAPDASAAPRPPTARPEPIRAVSFMLGGDEYALPIAQVREVIAFRRPRDVGSPTPWVRGVISLRGRIVPVCDLAARLGRGGEAAPSPKIVVVETPAGTAGLIVDSVREVLAVDAEHVDRVPLAGDEAVTGIARLGDRLVVMLDAAAVLAEAGLGVTARSRA